MRNKKSNPFEYSDSNKRYYTFDYYLRQKFGKKVARITIDAGFSCPNIDGTCGINGCTYCSHIFDINKSISSLKEQFDKNLEIERKKWPDCGVIVYLNEGTNTYAPLQRLKEIYEEVLSYDGVLGIAIATRVDALNDEIIEYLKDLSNRTYLLLELGLQTTNDATADAINRGYTYNYFKEIYAKLHGINVCIHIINGLPGETKHDMLNTIKNICKLHPQMIKIHMLYLTKGTKMEKEWQQDKFHILSLEEYVDIVVSQLELLPKDIVIGRITGDGDRSKLVEPQWSLKKLVVFNEIDKLMAKENTWQGAKYTK